MSLSTSSFRMKPLYKLLLCVALVAASTELLFRCFGPLLSKDTKHLAEISARARIFDSGSPGILFLGNSTTREGVNRELLDEKFNVEEPSLRLTAFYPDDSYLREWLYLYRKQFQTKNVPPDLLVIPFSGGWLQDKPIYQPERLGHFFVGKGDLVSLLSECSFEEKLRLLTGASLASMVYRERVRKRTLNALVPNFQELAHASNKTRQRVKPMKGNPPESYSLLEKLQKTTNAQNTTLVFVALPTPFEYELSPHLVDQIALGGSHCIDLRDSIPVAPENYKDGIHMSPKGAELFTIVLAEELKAFTERLK